MDANIKNILYPRFVFNVGVTLETTKSEEETSQHRAGKGSLYAYSTAIGTSLQEKDHNALCELGRYRRHKPMEEALKIIINKKNT